MKHPEPKTPEELENMIIKHPVVTFFHMRTGLLEEINSNAENLIRILKLNLKGILLLGEAILIAVRHMGLIAIYPVWKLYRLMVIRKIIMEKPGSLRLETEPEKEN